ncbi:elongation factor Ts [Candidatus Roizmanbacteria bacterium CG_4_9_14_0_2_um_filter_39_13]|uniref:Elongation factor Ts n=2 Tax=Candidatus Roizmaniibacteriota TaxID=1752723 RepID=A0A2M8F0P7_9BACT|nr:MAG: elongation factor Ts [Candidatus Roizmanbacteria bacterium CG_4_10_14_0_2_um_filter_39_12]PJC32864.1 MAG: elongation factor Ts [Candidatus Roizmanbacteria bacterium CG_4_9_14_0_2_um_filter_39_13]PJE61405.1 MAG: elongation factor Ts [Candidatus Roizmanbacteria bacterium CG10_big_fil_rev_8_21_14_0_10_39_12]
MIDYKKLKQLREETQVSFSLCKKALDETDNDMKKSMELLKKWGAEKAAKKADRNTEAGGMFTYVHHNKKIAALVELQSETDFVSENKDFQKLGSEIAMQVASVPSSDVDELLKQDYIREPGKTVDGLVKEAILKFGENIKIARILRWELGE